MTEGSPGCWGITPKGLVEGLAMIGYMTNKNKYDTGFFILKD